jgi:hypothetical protein
MKEFSPSEILHPLHRPGIKGSGLNEDEASSFLENFIDNWEEEFRYVHDILNQISFFSVEQSGPFYPGPIVSYEKRKTDQRLWYQEYIDLSEQEKELIQLHWVAIWVDQMTWFVDLADLNFPVISIYQFEEPTFCWYSFSIYPNISNILDDLNKGKTCRDFLRIYEDSWFEADCREYDRVEQMKSDGQLPLDEIFLPDVFVKGVKSYPLYNDDNGIFTFRDVLPLVIYLLPHHLDIVLNSVQCDYRTEDYADTFQAITKLQQFIYLLYAHGQEHFPKYHFSIPEYGAEVYHNFSNEFRISGLIDVDARESLMENIDHLQPVS